MRERDTGPWRYGVGQSKVLRALEILARKPPLTIPELAIFLGQSDHATRRLVYRLVHESYLVKTPDNFPAKYTIVS